MSEIATNAGHQQALTLAGYIRRRNGVPAGARGGLRNMLARSFGAQSFAGFWRYWNPVFGYIFGRYVYQPARRVLPRAFALIVTFLVCGVVHDLVTMAVRGAPAFLFTPWFFFLGLGVVVSEALGWHTGALSRGGRTAINAAYLVAALALAPGARHVIGG